LVRINLSTVIPEVCRRQAPTSGIQKERGKAAHVFKGWTPAFAGVTGRGAGVKTMLVLAAGWIIRHIRN